MSLLLRVTEAYDPRDGLRSAELLTSGLLGCKVELLLFSVQQQVHSRFSRDYWSSSMERQSGEGEIVTTPTRWYSVGVSIVVTATRLQQQ